MTVDTSEPIKRGKHSPDPRLSPEANRLLTDELREVLGDDTLRVPNGELLQRAQRQSTHGQSAATLFGVRRELVVLVSVLVIVAGILTLGSGGWWLVGALLVLLAAASLVVHLTHSSYLKRTEHVDPRTAAKLEDEGIVDPDGLLTELVEDYRSAEQSG